MLGNPHKTRTIAGISATPLSGLGTVRWYRSGEQPDPAEISAADPETEQQRFDDAQAAAREELETERESTRERVGSEEAAVFDAHLQFLTDPQLTDPIEAAIADGAAAELAVDEAFGDAISQFEGMDGMMAERADDLRDIRDRLLRLLSGGERTDLTDLPEGTVLRAERLTPSDTAQLDPDTIAGFVTMTGGRTSHVSIFARSLGIPAIVGAGEELREVREATTVAIDADREVVVANPDAAVREQVTVGRDVTVQEERVETRDGTEIEVAANIGTAAELDGAVDQGADGVGLFRTEFLFLDRETPPSEDEQFESYVDALDAFPEGRVVVRTLDIGGDKPIPYLDLPEEENPFLGSRGIRRSLGADSELFETQLRALLRAAAAGEGTLSVMFPLVSTLDELTAALEAVDRVASDLDNEGIDYAKPELGVMIETPAAVMMAEEFAERVDFLSIGTNDLAQYVMAADRENEAVAELHDPQQPAVLRAINRAVEAAHAHDAWIGMCGEMAGDPELTELLVGLGLDELSMSAVTIPAVKANITEIERSTAVDRRDRALTKNTKSMVNETGNQ
ncbi:phosphotransferase system enzyme I (PtsI) [Halohasta litchfieldiae]|jgi:phosphotransferase system enzyme I (PtsI)|uniref:Phosphoenolpyruvate-protein phosphotransferase n=1 Tax=Halohasta litchfieldiae TaxID=1073996 RepID=A0A1H6W9M6_9EURY|nr:phosphoenolpyruvate--protein phosphotransferase [Halohasta litchfieldiae]ATW89993.1 phosphotransferase system enzyme I (PtsI) [Halohasta litchfieldiae]SEJ13603.1 phosphoenolpyruvate--protein phosphotransferase [Halohasta litchfieldiae]